MSLFEPWCWLCVGGGERAYILYMLYTHTGVENILAWRVPWTKEPGRGWKESDTTEHTLYTCTRTHTHTHIVRFNESMWRAQHRVWYTEELHTYEPCPPLHPHFPAKPQEGTEPGGRWVPVIKQTRTAGDERDAGPAPQDSVDVNQRWWGPLPRPQRAAFILVRKVCQERVRERSAGGKWR